MLKKLHCWLLPLNINCRWCNNYDVRAVFFFIYIWVELLDVLSPKSNSCIDWAVENYQISFIFVCKESILFIKTYNRFGEFVDVWKNMCFWFYVLCITYWFVMIWRSLFFQLFPTISTSPIPDARPTTSASLS